MDQIAEFITDGNAVLGIEIGSTRIKSSLIDGEYNVIASGSYVWENKFVDGYWTYSQEDIWKGLQGSYLDLCGDVFNRYRVHISKLKAIGVSAMMHGYLPFGANGEQLVPFRTWLNSTTAAAAEKLTILFGFHVPQRWSIAHLYQAILTCESHVKDVCYLTTLAGYVHWKLTGCKAVGVGEASGIVPLNADGTDYDEEMVSKFDKLVSPNGFSWKLRGILPKILRAGATAGYLTVDGAKLLDASGKLLQGTPFCPPEGDAQTGMTSTNSVKAKTGNISAGTSVFAMITLDKPLSKYYREVDIVATPQGKPTAMVHCNNCSSDINAWADIFAQFASASGINISRNDLYGLLFAESLKGDDDCAEMLSYNFLSGEHIVDLTEGRPIFARSPDCKFTLANFIKNLLYSSFCVLKRGMDVLCRAENVQIDNLVAQGGMFKIKHVAQQILSNALNVPILVRDTAGEGGAWGMALLASYMLDNGNLPLDEFLDLKVFSNRSGDCVRPSVGGVKGFNRYYNRFLKCLDVERETVRRLK